MDETLDNLSYFIRHLGEVPESIPALITMFVEEWGPYYGVGGPGNAEADLKACMSAEQLPFALVALRDDGAVVGTGALKTGSVGAEPGEEPWISALVIVPEERGRGIGRTLISRLIDEAHRREYSSVYMSTDAADRLLKDRTWQELRQTTSLRGPIGVYRLDIS